MSHVLCRQYDKNCGLLHSWSWYMAFCRYRLRVSNAGDVFLLFCSKNLELMEVLLKELESNCHSVTSFSKCCSSLSMGKNSKCNHLIRGSPCFGEAHISTSRPCLMPKGLSWCGPTWEFWRSSSWCPNFCSIQSFMSYPDTSLLWGLIFPHSVKNIQILAWCPWACLGRLNGEALWFVSTPPHFSCFNHLQSRYTASSSCAWVNLLNPQKVGELQVNQIEPPVKPWLNQHSSGVSPPFLDQKTHGLFHCDLDLELVR